MKPTPPSNDISTLRESYAVRSTSAGWQKTDHQFKADGPADFGRCHGNPDPSFRRIGDDYFKNEARAHFLSEAVMFVSVIATAAVPVVHGIRGAYHLLSETGLL